MTVIIVDDERLILEELYEVVCTVLPQAAVTPFIKASEAAEYAKENHIDIAFLDIKMTVINGIALAEEIQKHSSKANIIFCTGYSEYSLDALDLYCSGYLLKPITEKKVRKALSNLRYPIKETPKVMIRCFGNFEVFFNGRPMNFKYSKTKELLACLVDKNGADVSTGEMMTVLFEEEDKPSYFDNIRVDLLSAFQDIGQNEVIRKGWGKLGLDKTKVQCDYFDYLDGKNTKFFGEYMEQYSFGEITKAGLLMREKE